MRKTLMMSAVLAVAGLMGATQFALADMDCGPNAVQNQSRLAAEYRNDLRKAEAAERAGKLKEAEALLRPNVGGHGCAGDVYKEMAVYATMLKRVSRNLGQQAEKQGNLAAAFDYYVRSTNVATYQIDSAGKFDFSKPEKPNYADADRIKMKQVNASPRNRQLVSDAINYFGHNDTSKKEMLQLAAKNADLELANEEKAFAAHKESFDELGKAKDWFYLVGESAAKKVRERAEQRGDTLAKEDVYRHLENAKHYFSFAEAKKKEQALQDKALRLAQAHEKKGEISQAQNFYSLAGASAKGNELQERADAQHKKSEDKRQKQFKKGQSDLEKELGM